MQQFLPELYATFRSILENGRDFGKIPWARHILKGMLFNSPEDKIFHAQYKQMEIYIEPLKRMIAGIALHDTPMKAKLNQMLYILCNPSKSVPLETLINYEPILDKMIRAYKVPPLIPEIILMWIIKITLRSPTPNRTLQRTFKPRVQFACGTLDICAPRRLKLTNVAYECEEEYEPKQKIPHVLQGEIAQLDQKFNISLDTMTQNSKTIQLICYLDDRLLPCVPPIIVTIPDEYPFVSPKRPLLGQEYSATPFLLAVQNYLIRNIAQLPECYSLTRLLDIWEMSVRRACSPTIVAVNDLATIFGI